MKKTTIKSKELKILVAVLVAITVALLGAWLVARQPENPTVGTEEEVTFPDPSLDKTQLYDVFEWSISFNAAGLVGISHAVVLDEVNMTDAIDFTTASLELTNCDPFRVIRGFEADLLNNGDLEVFTFDENYERAKLGFESVDPLRGLSLLHGEQYFANGPQSACEEDAAITEYQKIRNALDGSFDSFNL